MDGHWVEVKIKTVGIGTCVRMVFSDPGPGLSLPQWAIDGSATQPDKPWRYPQESGGAAGALSKR